MYGNQRSTYSHSNTPSDNERLGSSLYLNFFLVTAYNITKKSKIGARPLSPEH